MTRQLRIEYEGAFYHVTSRGNQRGQVFWNDQDKDRFIKILRRTKERYGYLLHAYVLMRNHIPISANRQGSHSHSYEKTSHWLWGSL